MKVGIVIVSFNHWLFTKRCIDSIVAGTDRDKYTICLADNGSTDETKAEANKLLSNGTLDSFISNDYNMGACKASNQGVELIMKDNNTTHVMVMANDHVVTPNWLEPMLVAPTDCTNPFVFHSVAEVRALCPAIGKLIERYKPLRLEYLQEDSEENMNYVLEHTYRDLNKFSALFTSYYVKAPYITTERTLWPGLILYKKHVIEEIGLKDEEYLKFDLASYADIDYYLRVHLAGFTSSVTMTSFVHHWGSITTRKLGLKQDDVTGYVNKEKGAYDYFVKKWGCDPHNLAPLLNKGGR